MFFEFETDKNGGDVSKGEGLGVSIDTDGSKHGPPNHESRCKQEGNRPLVSFPFSKPEQRHHCDKQRIFKNSLEQDWSDHRSEHTAQNTTDGNPEIELGEVSS